MTQYIEDFLPPIKSSGLNTQDAASFGSTLNVTGVSTLTGGIAGQEMLVTVLGTGTTAASVFGASGLPYAINITRVFLISDDTTAGNVTVEAPAATVVCTIAKGTTAGNSTHDGS